MAIPAGVRLGGGRGGRRARAGADGDGAGGRGGPVEIAGTEARRTCPSRWSPSSRTHGSPTSPPSSPAWRDHRFRPGCGRRVQDRHSRRDRRRLRSHRRPYCCPALCRHCDHREEAGQWRLAREAGLQRVLWVAAVLIAAFPAICADQRSEPHRAGPRLPAQAGGTAALNACRGRRPRRRRAGPGQTAEDDAASHPKSAAAGRVHRQGARRADAGRSGHGRRPRHRRSRPQRRRAGTRYRHCRCQPQRGAAAGADRRPLPATRRPAQTPEPAAPPARPHAAGTARSAQADPPAPPPTAARLARRGAARRRAGRGRRRLRARRGAGHGRRRRRRRRRTSPPPSAWKSARSAPRPCSARPSCATAFPTAARSASCWRSLPATAARRGARRTTSTTCSRRPAS